ncbi:Peptidyl-tRNA hydrolase [bioreactor metagenome]|uniref:peptidyl-tRNA hydrolase n=1 Tax=bioreactor metagenome TaxID=1076179 RepID=A0A644WKF3_9ZZZZ
MFFQRQRGGTDWLLVFLGNPGDQYENSRHNVGFRVGDEIAGRQRTEMRRLRFRALTAAVTVGGVKALLMKPMTYMNLSGEAVGEAARFYKLEASRVLVVSDDISLPLGKIRIRREGSAGGHNGLKSIIAHLGTEEFPRLKVGVGSKPHPEFDLADWVLSSFSPADNKVVNEAVLRAADAIECLLSEGVEKAMGKFN